LFRFYQRNDNHPTAVACLFVIAQIQRSVHSPLGPHCPSLLRRRRSLFDFKTFSFDSSKLGKGATTLFKFFSFSFFWFLDLKLFWRNNTNGTIERHLFRGSKP
jgi:hypothetical protein